MEREMRQEIHYGRHESQCFQWHWHESLCLGFMNLHMDHNHISQSPRTAPRNGLRGVMDLWLIPEHIESCVPANPSACVFPLNGSYMFEIYRGAVCFGSLHVPSKISVLLLFPRTKLNLQKLAKSKSPKALQSPPQTVTQDCAAVHHAALQMLCAFKGNRLNLSKSQNLLLPTDTCK